MSRDISGFAPAKINLALHVIGRREDGYHLLDSLVAFADIGDSLSITPAAQLSLEVIGPQAEGVPTDDSNLVLRAARMAGGCGHIILDKQLPAMGGIGGGSSDAAACLRLLGAEVDAVSLGADVPVCLLGQGARMAGIGEQVTAHSLPELPAVVVNPGVGAATPDVFAALTQRQNTDLGILPEFADVESVIDWCATQRNDLEPAAQSLVPEIGSALHALSGAGAALARMSGSGSTCFGLFESYDQAQLAADLIGAMQDDWWVRACRLS